LRGSPLPSFFPRLMKFLAFSFHLKKRKVSPPFLHFPSFLHDEKENVASLQSPPEASLRREKIPFFFTFLSERVQVGIGEKSRVFSSSSSSSSSSSALLSQPVYSAWEELLLSPPDLSLPAHLNPTLGSKFSSSFISLLFFRGAPTVALLH